MSVNVNLEDYQIAQELLDSSQELFESTSNEVNSVAKTLDRKVLTYVEKELNNAGESIHTLKANEADISGEITTHASKIVDIEGKAIQDLAAITGATEVEETEKQTHHVWDEGKEVLSSLGDVALAVTKSLLDVGAAAVKGAFSLLTFNLGGLFDSCKTVLEAAVHIGTKVVSFVKESFDFLASFFASAVASIANLVTSLVEGIVSFVEAIVDAAAVVAGAIASIFTGIFDGINWVCSKIFDYEFKSATKAMWTNGFLPFIGTDWTDKMFDYAYENWGFFKWLETNSFGPFKREGGFIYSVGKGVGYTVGLVIATVCTAGIAGGASGIAGAAGNMATGISTVFAGIGGMGKGTQKGYQKVMKGLDEGEELSGGDILKVLGYGVGSGTIEAGAWYLTFGNGKTFLTAGKNMAGQKVASTIGWTDKMFSAGANGITTVGQKVFGEGFKVGATELSKMGIQFTKTYANAALEWATINPDKNVFSAETFQDATIAAAVSIIYDKTLSGQVGKLSDWVAGKVSPHYTTSSTFTTTATNGTTSTAGGSAIADVANGADVPIVDSANEALDAIAKAFIKNGCGKVFGGFVKKFMDYRNIPKAIGIAS